jgi:hypothetical protein
LNDINNQNAYIAPTLDNLLIELTKLNEMFILDDKRRSHPTPTYKLAEKIEINKQSTKIAIEIDKIIGQFSNDKTGHITRTPTINVSAYDEIKRIRDELKVKPVGDKFEDIELFTNKIGKAILPAKSVTESPEPVMTPMTDMPPPPAIPSAKRREPLFPTRPPTAPVVNRAVTEVPIVQPVTPQAITPRTKPATSNVYRPTFASQMRENAEIEFAKDAKKHMDEAAHNRQAFKNKVRIGGKSTKKKSRKSSRAKRHTKRAMSRKQQNNTRNKREKRGRNQTHKK